MGDYDKLILRSNEKLLQSFCEVMEGEDCETKACEIGVCVSLCGLYFTGSGSFLSLVVAYGSRGFGRILDN